MQKGRGRTSAPDGWSEYELLYPILKPTGLSDEPESGLFVKKQNVEFDSFVCEERDGSCTFILILAEVYPKNKKTYSGKVDCSVEVI